MEGVLLLAVIALCIGTWIGVRVVRGGVRPVPKVGHVRELQALNLSEPSGECDFHIVGESNHQPELRRVAKSGRTFVAVLKPEPSNSRDPNAIRVCAEGGRTVGYLDRGYAIEYREAFRRLARHGRAAPAARS